MEDQRFRHEWKHVISPADCAILRSRLRVLLPADQNGDSNGRYHIRSLYFDNPEDKVLREKLDGVSNRDKYRIRYYNHDPGFIKLEKKSKRNGLCRKDSVRVSAEEAQRIVHGDWKWTESSEKRLLRDLFLQCFTAEWFRRRLWIIQGKHLCIQPEMYELHWISRSAPVWTQQIFSILSSHHTGR